VLDVIFNSRHCLHGVKLENKLYNARTAEAGSTIRAGKGCESAGRGVKALHNSDVTPQYSTIDCLALLCCVRRSCDADVFDAINKSGLVYDGGAVVDQVRSSRRNTYETDLSPRCSIYVWVKVRVCRSEGRE
jgi:hypothetical protein